MIVIGVEVLVLSIVCSWLVTPLAISMGRRFGAVDHPGPRKVHTSPIPRIGGVSVFLGFLVGLVFAAVATGFLPAHFSAKGAYWGSLASAATAVFVMGLLDDLWGLSFRWKFGVQIAAGVLVWYQGFRIDSLSVPFLAEPLTLGPFSVVVTVLWIVGVTNAINLIDGLDGLAAGMALISTTTVAVIALVGGRVAVTAAAVALVGSLIGFLPYNFSPARIFLGDSGSMLLGFLLAVLSIHAGQKGTTVVAVLAPILVVGVPLVDTGLAVLRRLYRLGRGRGGGGSRIVYMVRHVSAVFLPDREHLHHRLLDLGLSQRAAVLTLYLGAIMMALTALSLVLVKSPGLALVLLAVVGLLVTAFLTAVAVARARAGTAGGAVDPRRPRSWFLSSWKPLRDSTVTPPE